MLNEDLIDPKDLKIAKLKLAIENFKKYDKERKAYYSKSLIELGQLKDYVEELEATIPEGSRKELRRLNQSIASYKQHCEHLETIIEAYKNKEQLEPELIQLQFYKESYLNIKEVLKKCQENNLKRFQQLKKEIKRLQAQRDQLLYRIGQNE